METPLGLLPAQGELNTDGLEIDQEALEELLTVDPDALGNQVPQMEEFLGKFGDRLPEGIERQLEALRARLGD